MLCMKCGREIHADQVFCPECLAVMEKYPVKPGTVVQLPRRSEQPPVKKPPTRHRTVLSPEEQLPILKKRIRNLVLALLLCLSVIIGLSFLVVREYKDEVEAFLPGQNYSSTTPSSPVASR